MFFYSSLGILAIAIGASFIGGRFFAIGEYAKGRLGKFNIILAIFNNRTRFLKSVLFTSLVIIASISLFYSIAQYNIWKQGELSKFLLPPHQSINYFLFYTGMRFWAPYLVSLVIGYSLFFAMRRLNKRHDGKFFYDEEFWMAMLSVFLASHPGWLIYLIILLLSYLLIHLYSLFILHDSDTRISFYYLWLPAAILVILFTEFYLENQPWWKLLVI